MNPKKKASTQNFDVIATVETKITEMITKAIFPQTIPDSEKRKEAEGRRGSGTVGQKTQQV